MRTLFLDIASHEKFLALLSDDHTIQTTKVHNRATEATLIDSIESLLHAAGWAYKDLTHIVVTTGPGGFMSLRVGIALANALSWSLKIPLAGIHLSDLWAARLSMIHSQKTPSPNPSPWPFVAYATAGQQGEGGGIKGGFFNRYLGRIWRGTDERKRPPHAMTEYARGMRKQPTKAEEILWSKIKSKKLNGLYFRRQRPVGKYILDFYCEKLKLAIEVDGGIHTEEGIGESDAHRMENLNERGISVMRFSNDDIINRMDDILPAILAFHPVPLPRLIPRERSELGVPGEGSGVGAKIPGGEPGVGVLWLHSTKKSSLFARGFGEWKKHWPTPTLVDIDDLVKILKERTLFLGELIEEHRHVLPLLEPMMDVCSVADSLPSLLRTCDFKKEILEPWYGRNG